MATTTLQLAKLHVLQFLTYHRSDEQRAEVENWLAGLGAKDAGANCHQFQAPYGGDGLAQVDLARKGDPLDVLMVLFQEVWEPTAGLDECLGRFKAAREFRVVEGGADVGRSHMPPSPWLGRTTVLMAEDAGDRDETKRALNAGIRPGDKEILGGGAIGDGIDLYADEACELVFVLARPDAEAEAARRTYENLRSYLTFVHKTRAQRAEYAKHHPAVKELPPGLKDEVKRMIRQVDGLAADPDRSKLLREALAQRIRLVETDRPFRKALGAAEAMRTTLVANRLNLQHSLKVVGQGPGIEALARQIDHVDGGIATIDADLAYARPELEAVDRVIRDHNDGVLTAQSLAEARANDLSERDEEGRDRRNFWLALLAAWLGLNQIWATAVGIAYGRDGLNLTLLVRAGAWMLAPAVVFGLLLLRWLRPHPDQNRRGPDR